MMFKKGLCLFVCIAALSLIADADHKIQPGVERFFSALTKEVDSHLKQSLLAVAHEEPIQTSNPSTTYPEVEYSKALQKEIKEFFDTLKIAVDHNVKKKLVSQTTKEVNEVKTPLPKTDCATEVKSTTTQSTPDCVEDFHPTEGYTKTEIRHTTTDAYSTGHPEPSSTYQGYSTKVRFVGGVPGVDFPNYTDIPVTSFTCSDKEFVPGFYADLESRCQVFHVCYPHRRESFLCPKGTTFNQPLLACDYWYSTNCSLSPHYFSVNAEASELDDSNEKSKPISSMISDILQKSSDSTDVPKGSKVETSAEAVLSFVTKFLPVKAKVVIYPESDGKRAKVVAEASIGVHKERKMTGKRSEQFPTVTQKVKTFKVKVAKEQPVTPNEQPISKSEEFNLKIRQIYEPKFAFWSQFFDDIGKDTLSKLKNLWYEFLNAAARKQGKIESRGNLDGHEIEDRFRKEVARITNEMIATLKQGLDAKMKKMTAKKVTPLNPRFSTVVQKEKVRAQPTHGQKVIRRPVVKKYKLTPLNPRFIVKPAVVPKTAGSVSEQNNGLNVSPLTKKALSRNYVRFLKIKSG